jgi:regulator of RNase E activity RraA
LITARFEHSVSSEDVAFADMDGVLFVPDAQVQAVLSSANLADRAPAG